jgi:hypothetical protein
VFRIDVVDGAGVLHTFGGASAFGGDVEIYEQFGGFVCLLILDVF